jgi:hypothetical protein
MATDGRKIEIKMALTYVVKMWAAFVSPNIDVVCGFL